MELEVKYSLAMSEKTGEKIGSIKKQFRDNLSNRINADYSGEQRIKNMVEKIENY